MIDLQAFRGAWTMVRRIRDRRTGRRSSFTGTAVFRGDAEELAVEERGTLAFGDQVFEARRAYRWRQRDSLIEVLFEDGRAFHDFRPDERRPAIRHPCGADLYRGRYGLARWPVWTTFWIVAGPRKDYAMRTRYARPQGPVRECWTTPEAPN